LRAVSYVLSTSESVFSAGRWHERRDSLVASSLFADRSVTKLATEARSSISLTMRLGS